MVTLDIEDTCIKMTVVKGKSVEMAATLPLEPGLVEDGVVTDTVTVGQRIRELMAEHAVEENRVVAAVSGVHSIYRVASLPKLPKAMLGEAARHEMERVTPVPMAELHTSWQAISTSDVETVMCLVGLPRNTIDAMLETLRQAGLECQSMDVRPLALARVADEKDAIIVNVQPAAFDIVVTVDGITQLLRSLTFPAGDMSASDKVAVIKEELDRTVTFYNSGHKERPIAENVALFLGGELRELLAEALGYRAKPLPEWLSYPEGLDAGEYAVNVGLALQEVKVGVSLVRVSVNVLPEAYLPKRRPIMEVVSWIFVLAAVVVLVPLAVLTHSEVSETSLLQAEVDKAHVQVEIRQGTQAMLAELQVKVDELKVVRDVFEQPLQECEAQRAKVNGDLSKVTSLLPATVDLSSISYSREIAIEVSTQITQVGEESTEVTMLLRMLVAGTAPDEETVLSYARDLRDSDRFANVVLLSMGEVEYNEWSFSLATDVQEGEAE